jgi:hypothetical protein
MATIGVLLLAWLLIDIAFVLAWSTFRASVRRINGIDEEAYVNGMDISI